MVLKEISQAWSPLCLEMLCGGQFSVRGLREASVADHGVFCGTGLDRLQIQRQMEQLYRGVARVHML